MPLGYGIVTVLDYQGNQKQMRQLDEGGAGGGPFLPCVSPQPGGDALNNHWSFSAPAGGLSGVTPLAIVAAPGATLRRYVASIQIAADALSAASEFVLREPGGAVLWRIKIPLAGLPLEYVAFPVPIKPALAAGLEVALLSSVTGAIYCNVQGFTAP